MNKLLLLAATPSSAPNGAVNLSGAVNPVVEMINSLVNPALAIVGAVGMIYCILLGVKFAKAEEPQEHEKAKNHLKNAIIGFVLIFVLMLLLKVGVKEMGSWYERNLPAASSALDMIKFYV